MKIEVTIHLSHLVRCKDTMTIDIPDEELIDMSDNELWDTIRDAAFERSKIEFEWDEEAVETERQRIRSEGGD